LSGCRRRRADKKYDVAVDVVQAAWAIECSVDEAPGAPDRRPGAGWRHPRAVVGIADEIDI
jgi:hypothetical protein